MQNVDRTRIIFIGIISLAVIVLCGAFAIPFFIDLIRGEDSDEPTAGIVEGVETPGSGRPHTVSRS